MNKEKTMEKIEIYIESWINGNLTYVIDHISQQHVSSSASFVFYGLQNGLKNSDVETFLRMLEERELEQ